MIHFVVPAFDFTFRKGGKEHIQRDIVDGYYAQGKRQPWGNPRAERYVEWKKHVWACAEAAGVIVPCWWTEGSPVYIVVVAYFRTRTHQDVQNVDKGIRDALVYQPRHRGDDRWCCGFHTLPRYDRDDPRAEVWIFGKDEKREFVELVEGLCLGQG